MDAAAAIEKLTGEELSPALSDRLATAPWEHIALLAQTLAPVYYDWLENEEQRRKEDSHEVHHCLDPYPRKASWQQQVSRLKGFLLYFPRITVPDPLAAALWPPITWAQVLRKLGEPPLFVAPGDESAFRSRLRRALLLLTELRPLITRGEIVPVPAPFALDYSVVQDAARKAVSKVDSLPEGRGSAYDQCSKECLGAVKVWQKVCAMCDYTPVAARPWVGKVLQADIDVVKLRCVPGIDVRSAQLLRGCELPSISNVSMSTIVSLRKNGDAFDEWRSDFHKVMATVDASSVARPEQAAVELQRGFEDILRPRVEQLKEKIKGSPVMDKIFTPAVLALAGSVVTFSITGDPHVSLTGALVSASLSPAAWMIEKLGRRYRKSGRKDALLAEFYGQLLNKDDIDS